MDDSPGALQLKLARYAEATRVFTPGAPVDHLSLFAGRLDQIREVINAVGQRGQHVVLYGERGVGKTSLANILSDFFSELHLGSLRAVRVNCNTSDSFFSLWRKVFRELGRLDELEQVCGENKQPDPEEIRYLLQREEVTNLVVIDELDRLEDDEALSLLADTIKTMSDNSVAVTLVLVGVADSIDELVGDHQSVERAIAQIPMQRMSISELEAIIRRGLERLKLTSAAGSSIRIAQLSEGLPHYTHLLGLHAAQQTIMDGREQITMKDVDAVVSVAVEKASHSIRSAYQKATRSTRPESQFEQVLLACALAPKDELGYFTASAVRGPLSEIMGKPYDTPAFARHLTKFSEPERGSVLQRVGEMRRIFYRFTNPLLQPYVVLHGLSSNLITEDTVSALQTAEPGDDG